jgi:hypothetical protein
MKYKSIEEKTKRKLELLKKRASVGLTLTEGWELISLNAELDLLPLIDAAANKGVGNIEEE